jgi:hypothetical protein
MEERDAVQFEDAHGRDFRDGRSLWCVLCLARFTPPALIAGIVYGRGYGRAFSIGCVAAGGSLPMIYLYIVAIAIGFSGLNDAAISFGDDVTLAVRIYSGILFAFVGFSGLTGMVVRWLSPKMAGSEASNTGPQYSILQRRIATVEASIEPNRLTTQSLEEA